MIQGFARWVLVGATIGHAACGAPAPGDSGAPARKQEVETTVAIDEGAKPWPTGDLVREPITIAFAVYALPGIEVDVLEAAKRLHAKAYAHLPAFEGPDAMAAKPGLWISTPPLSEFAPPDAESLRFFGRGLSPEQVIGVQTSPMVVLLTFTSDAANASRVHGDAIAMLAVLAEKTGGLVWDENTRELFTRAAWRAREQAALADPTQISKHFTLHSYRDDEFLRIVSLGLEKFGLPNIAVANVPVASSDGMAKLVNLVAMAMARTPRIEREGVIEVEIATPVDATKPAPPVRADVRLAVGEPHEGDAPGPLAQIVFPGPRATLHERQDALLDLVLGLEDSIVDADHDAELLAASARAKQQLAAMKPRFAKGIPDMELLMVKAPFATPDGGNEWMWLEVVRWEGSTISGILQNDPFRIPGLKSGANVEVDEDSVFDYTHRAADGTERGNETGVILQRRETGK